MNNLNSIILEGNLTRDSELLEATETFKVCKFSIAVNRWYKNNKNEGVEEVSFFDVECYGKLAEHCAKKGTKGRGVRVVGRLKQNTWKDENGKTHSKVLVIAEHIEYKPQSFQQQTEPATTPPEKVPEAVAF
ncbi:MAG: single-stranded DNA-binding protein [Spirochaetaceae bacterium]|nr:single-stranded DNA-binding protein [Spirochaetaceae bacterium]